MKRPKVFLAVTTCLLAIAGVAATKATKFGTTPGFYFTKQTSGNCVALPNENSFCDYLSSGLKTCITVISAKTYKIYTSSLCTHLLKYNNQ